MYGVDLRNIFQLFLFSKLNTKCFGLQSFQGFRRVHLSCHVAKQNRLKENKILFLFSSSPNTYHLHFHNNIPTQKKRKRKNAKNRSVRKETRGNGVV